MILLLAGHVARLFLFGEKVDKPCGVNIIDGHIELRFEVVVGYAVEEDRLLSVDGNPGREATMRIGEKDSPSSAHVLFRGFIVKGRYYQIMALGTKAGMEKGRIEDFMDSFQLMKALQVKK